MSDQTLKPSKATKEEIERYWGFHRVLDSCQDCHNHGCCWSHEGAVYHTRIIKGFCKNEEVKQAVAQMTEMKRGKPLFFYARRGIKRR